MDCLDDAALAEVAAGAEPSAEQSRHLDECARCAGRLAQLRAAAGTLPAERISGVSDTALTRTAISQGEHPAGAQLAAPQLGRGDTLGRYMIIGPLGAGGMGRVYAAFDPDLGRKLALKLLHAEATAAEHAAELRTRLLREAQAMARLSSPNVVAVYDVGTVGGQVWVAMELVEGQTLTAWLAGGPRAPDEIVARFLDAGRGLAAAHATGLVHRDFKPDNVLLDPGGHAKVTDFGLALPVELGSTKPGAAAIDSMVSRQAQGLDRHLTLAGTLLGTPAYMSPEQFLGEATDARSDQFSFCVALYEALYGERPFAGDDFATIRREVLAGAVRPAPAGNRVTPRLRAVLLRGLALRPDDRHASLEALLRELAFDPRRVRARRIARAGLALAVAAVGLGTLLLANRSSKAQPCVFGREELGDAWSPAREQALAATFAGSNAAGADSVWTYTRGELSRYAEAWLGMRRQACAATRVLGTQTEQAMQLRMFCLDRERAALFALTDLLAKNREPAALMKAPAAVADLPPVSDCGDVAHLTLEGEYESAKMRAAAEPLRRRIDSVRALVSLGQIATAQAESEGLVTAARGLHDPAVLAEALLASGIASQGAGREAAAHAALSEGVEQALLARKDVLAADNAANLLLGLALDSSNQEELAKVMQGIVERAGSPPHADTLLHYARGMSALAQGKYTAAAAAFADAVEIASRSGADDWARLAALTKEALALSHTHDAPKALGLAQQALALDERVLGPDNPRLCFPLLAVATHLMDAGRYEEARRAVERARVLIPRVFGPGSRAEIAAQEQLGLIAAHAGKLAEAERIIDGALQAGITLAHGAEDDYDAEYRLHLSRVLLREGKLDRAEEQARKCMAFLTRIAPESPDLADPLSVLGAVALARGDRATATADLEKALAYRRAGNDPPGDGARTRFALAQALSADDPARARELATEALQLDASMSGELQSQIAAWLAGGKSR